MISAAEHRPDRDRDAGDRAEDPERDAAILALERLGEQRERGREHDRAADALGAARDREEASSRSRARSASEPAVKITIPLANSSRRP